MRIPLISAACLMAGCTPIAGEEDPSATQLDPQGGVEAQVSLEELGPMAVYDRLVIEAAADANIVYSPTSVAQALGLVHLGASGETKSQIQQFLSISSGEAGDRELAARAAQLRKTERGVTVNIANALFLSEDWRFRPAFLEATGTIYGAPADRADFRNNPAGAAAKINAWANKATEGLISDVVAPNAIKRDAAAYLANATYFDGRWTRHFKGAEMRPFLFGDGSERPFRLMKNESDFASVTLDGWKAVRMTYGYEEKRFAFDVMMPEARVADATPPSHKAIQRMAELLDEAEPAPVRVWLPRFEADMRADLIPPLQALGLTLPFDRKHADLSAMAEPGQLPLYIGEAFQVAKLQVYESGTKAAAVTMMVAVPTSMPPPFEGPDFTVDRPFIFTIRDLKTGEVLFLGRIADPQAFEPVLQES